MYHSAIEPPAIVILLICMEPTVLISLFLPKDYNGFHVL